MTGKMLIRDIRNLLLEGDELNVKAPWRSCKSIMEMFMGNYYKRAALPHRPGIFFPE